MIAEFANYRSWIDWVPIVPLLAVPLLFRRVPIISLGTRRLYSARAESLLELRRFLDSFWDEGLLAVKQAAESSSGTELE